MASEPDNRYLQDVPREVFKALYNHSWKLIYLAIDEAMVAGVLWVIQKVTHIHLPVWVKGLAYVLGSGNLGVNLVAAFIIHCNDTIVDTKREIAKKWKE
jgi:hypothetical protein